MKIRVSCTHRGLISKIPSVKSIKHRIPRGYIEVESDDIPQEILNRREVTVVSGRNITIQEKDEKGESDRYYCEICGNNHLYSSNVGQDHLKHKKE